MELAEPGGSRISYDLLIQRSGADASWSPERAIDRVRELPHAGALEMHPLERGDDLVVLSLHASLDRQVLSTFYGALVELARTSGLALVDPQAGTPISLDAPGELPPGWASGEPVRIAAVRDLALRRRYAEIGNQIERIDLRKTDRHGLSALDHVLLSRIEGSTMRTGDPSWKALQSVAIEMIRGGADPLRRNEKGQCALLVAVRMDHSEVVTHILEGMDAAERAAILREKRDRKTLLDHAVTARSLFSDRTEKVLRKAGAK